MKVRGFTLVELLLAMAITAFVALLAYQGLSVAITAGERLRAQAQQMADLQLALSVIERDIRGALRRPVRNEYADEEYALIGDALEESFLQLTRRGWDNPAALRRPGLQRVRYRLEEKILWRENWQVLDRISEEEGLQQVAVLENIETVSLRFLDAGKNALTNQPQQDWLESWPPQGREKELPAAIEFTLELEGIGAIRRLIEVVDGK